MLINSFKQTNIKFNLFNLEKKNMSLIKSISGIRGTIGGKAGEGLTPIDTVIFASAFTEWVKRNGNKNNPTIIIGRDARISGEMVSQLVSQSIIGMGANVIDLGLSTTPTVEFAVTNEKADAGIILTASHNPAEWNALKLLNDKGEFISGENGSEVLRIAEQSEYDFADVRSLGKYTFKSNYISIHIKSILQLSLVKSDLITKSNFKIIVDGINSTGGTAVPELLRALGVKEITVLNDLPNGNFAHNPEPLPEHLTEISEKVVKTKADFGIVVDPDVDRLAFVNEDGTMFGEEYTLVSIADYVLSHKKGNTVSNLSSTRALNDITTNHGGTYAAAAVGEVNVVRKMKEINAVIGGEGNGGIIYPEAHYGRDALVGIALFLSNLAEKKMSLTALKATYPIYYMSKNKIELDNTINVDSLLDQITVLHSKEKINTEDGVKIDFADGWVHLRKSNTEPIIRIYSEGKTLAKANEYSDLIKKDVKSIIG